MILLHIVFQPIPKLSLSYLSSAKMAAPWTQLAILKLKCIQYDANLTLPIAVQLPNSITKLLSSLRYTAFVLYTRKDHLLALSEDRGSMWFLFGENENGKFD